MADSEKGMGMGMGGSFSIYIIQSSFFTTQFDKADLALLCFASPPPPPSRTDWDFFTRAMRVKLSGPNCSSLFGLFFSLAQFISSHFRSS